MKNLNFLSNLCGLRRASQSSDVGYRRRVVADLLPSFCRVNHVLTLLVVMLFTIGVGQMWGTLTTNVTIHAGSGTSHYAYVNSWSNGTQYDQVILCDSIKANRIGTGNNGKYYSDWRFYTSGSTSGSFSIDAYLGARLKSVTFTYSTSNSGALYLGSTKLTSGTAVSISGTSATFTTKNTNSATNGQVRLTAISVTYYPQTVVTLNANGGAANKTATFSYDETAYNSFTAVTRAGYTCTGYWTDASGGTKILNADGSRAANVSGWWTSNKWSKDAKTATLYAQWESDAACSADVGIGTASLNGSFNLSSVGVQCASITPGSNCAVAANNYGFIWYEGTGNKEIGGSGVTRVNNTTAYSSGTFSNTLSGSFTAGTTYTFRAFAINDKPSTAYSAAVSFTPYTVTFNMNGHGSAPSQQVVNTGGTASTPSAPSATGYTFGGWYQEAGCTNAVNWSSTITANKNYYAKWTAKEYTVTLDNESPTVSGSTSVTLTYNSASHAAITNPTKTGYTFAGWWTADNGTGTEVINTSGALQASVSNYTGAGGIWTRDNNSTTLYAKWTAKSFTVTWMVNGESYSAGGSTSVNFDSHVATLPTAPTPPCGNKFMGWTTTNIGSVGLDKDDDAAAITALNLFTTAGSAPTISAEGNVTYYAVFADYAEK